MYETTDATKIGAKDATIDDVKLLRANINPARGAPKPDEIADATPLQLEFHKTLYF